MPASDLTTSDSWHLCPVIAFALFTRLRWGAAFPQVTRLHVNKIG